MMKTYTLRQGDVVTSRILAILLHHADEPLCQAREDLFELRELGWTRQRRDPNLLMGDDRRLRRTGSPRRRWIGELRLSPNHGISQIASDQSHVEVFRRHDDRVGTHIRQTREACHENL